MALYLAGVVMNYSYIVAVFLALLAVYVADRIEDMDICTDKAGAKASAILLAAGSLVMANMAGALAGVALPLAIGLIYRWTFKCIPVAKSFVVAFCWAWSCSGWTLAGDLWGKLFAFLFCLQLVDTAYCDMRDLDSDRRKGIITLAMLLGRRTPGVLLASCVALAAWTAWTFQEAALLLVLGVAGIVALHSDFRRLETVERDFDIINIMLLAVVF